VLISDPHNFILLPFSARACAPLTLRTPAANSHFSSFPACLARQICDYSPRQKRKENSHTAPGARLPTPPYPGTMSNRVRVQPSAGPNLSPIVDDDLPSRISRAGGTKQKQRPRSAAGRRTTTAVPPRSNSVKIADARVPALRLSWCFGFGARLCGEVGTGPARVQGALLRFPSKRTCMNLPTPL
jgi:hypothetical protein